MKRSRLTLGVGAVGILLFSTSVEASFHFWDTNEVFSNADGTIQFVEMTTNSNSQHLLSGHVLRSSSTCFTFPSNLTSSATAGESMLLATSGFAALPGAPTPDYTIPDNFIDVNGDTIRLRSGCTSTIWDTFTFGPGQLPTDGVNSLNRDLTTGPATPTNFDEDVFAPPGVPGTGVPLTVSKVLGVPTGSRLELQWDDSACLGARRFQIAYGYGSQLPSSLGGVYGLQPANPFEQCNLVSSPKIWSGIPDPVVDPSNLMWFLMISEDGLATEGVWGTDSGSIERSGPGTGGSTGQCLNTDKSVINTCGQ